MTHGILGYMLTKSSVGLLVVSKVGINLIEYLYALFSMLPIAYSTRYSYLGNIFFSDNINAIMILMLILLLIRFFLNLNLCKFVVTSEHNNH